MVVTIGRVNNINVIAAELSIPGKQIFQFDDMGFGLLLAQNNPKTRGSIDFLLIGCRRMYKEKNDNQIGLFIFL